MAVHKLKEFLLYLISENIKKAIILKPENINYFLEAVCPSYSYLVFDIEKDKIILKVPEMEYENAVFFSTKYISVEIRENNIKEDLRYCNGVEDSFPIKYLKYIDKDFKIISEKLNQIKSIKNNNEIKLIKKACLISDKAIEYGAELVLNSQKPITENELASEIEYFMKKNGGLKPSFGTIAISDYKTSLPHGIPSDNTIKNILLMDIGTIYNGYCSDITRTIVLNKNDRKYVEIYNIVENAKLEVEKNLKEGVSVNELHNIAINEMGEYSKYFKHSLGHGVGVEVHEYPSLSNKLENDIILKENMVITIEPGIYLHNDFGVRIEDMYLIKKNKFEKLSNAKYY